MKKLKGKEKALEAVEALNQTKFVTVDQTLSLEAADFSLDHGLHMADALVNASARHHSAGLITSDDDLKGLANVMII